MATASDPYNRGDSSLAAHFWRSVESARFELQQCSACSETWFPPTTMCPSCWSTEYAWTLASGDATIWSTTRVFRAPQGLSSEQLPYDLVVGELVEGPLVLAPFRHVEGDSPPSIGELVVMQFGAVTHSDESIARYYFCRAPS